MYPLTLSWNVKVSVHFLCTRGLENHMFNVEVRGVKGWSNDGGHKSARILAAFFIARLYKTVSLYSQFILRDEFIPVFVRISSSWALAVNMCWWCKLIRRLTSKYKTQKAVLTNIPAAYVTLSSIECNSDRPPFKKLWFRKDLSHSFSSKALKNFNEEF